MGSVWFEWKSLENQLLITQAKDDRVVKPAAWYNVETTDIIGDRDEKTGGTRFGCSKQGRVAFLVDVTPSSHPGAELLTVKFLKGKMTPIEFAKELDMDKNLSLRLTFYLLVGDIHSKSLVYISKKSENKEIDEIRDVPRGFYYIDSTGIKALSFAMEGDGSTMLQVEYNGKANFYEIYFENGKRVDQRFYFDIE